VQGPCGQRSVRFSRPGCCSVGCQPGVGPRSGSLVERPQPKARTNDLDADKDRRRLRRPGRTAASVRSCRPPPRRFGEGSGGVVRAGAPSLIWVLAPWRGDKMIDGVIPGVRGRSVFQGRPRQRVTAGASREPAAAHLLRCGHRTHTGHLRRPGAVVRGSSGGSSGLTGASASSPSSTRTWRAWRASLRATDRVARLGVKRSLTFP
jgi:hypothetical protein